MQSKLYCSLLIGSLLTAIPIHANVKKAFEKFGGKLQKEFTSAPQKIKRFGKKLKTGPWHLPNAHLRYDQVTYLTAHNAFASSEEDFSVTYQQNWSLKKQQKHGVRGFMHDTWLHGGKVLLCHKGCSGKARDSTKGAGGDYRTFASALQLHKQFLDDHPDEVITIIIENRTNQGNVPIREVINNVPGLRNICLSQKDWDPDYYLGLWPPLEWMHKNNKRMVIFTSTTDVKEDDPFYYEWDYIKENQWAIVKGSGRCKHRKESQKRLTTRPNRRLVVLNQFGKAKAGQLLDKAREWNSYNHLKGLIKECTDFRHPNFLTLDFVEARHDQTMKFINELNAKEAAKYAAKQTNFCSAVFGYLSQEERKDALFHAVKKGSLSDFECLIKLNVPLTIKNKEGDTLLMMLLKSPTSNKDSVKIAVKIIDKVPAIIGMADSNGLSPLMAALKNNHSSLFKLMLNKVERPVIVLNQLDQQGNTLLHHAAQSAGIEIIKMILEKGANPLIKNKQGKTATDLASTQEIKNFISDQGTQLLVENYLTEDKTVGRDNFQTLLREIEQGAIEVTTLPATVKKKLYDRYMQYVEQVGREKKPSSCLYGSCSSYEKKQKKAHQMCIFAHSHLKEPSISDNDAANLCTQKMNELKKQEN